MKLKSNLNTTLVTAGLLFCSAVSADKVTTGEFVLNFDDAALLNIPTEIVNTAWFDEENSADKTGAAMRAVENPGCFIPETYTLKVFGDSIPTPPSGLQERVPQASTFDYTDDPSTGTGVIGLSGVHLIGGAFAGQLSFGDYHLSYDVSREGNAANGSGWFLTNNISFPAPAFDLTNVKTTIIDENNFTLAGDVVLTAGVAAMLLGTEGDDVGNFTFTTQPSMGPLASYSIKNKLLMLPVVKVGEKNYNVTLKLADSDNGQAMLDINCAKETTTNSAMPTDYDAETGIVNIPKLQIIDSNGLLGEMPVQMKLIEGSSPLKFAVIKVGQ